MQIVTTRDQMRSARAAYTALGFVPTMGYLHEGHLSLVRRAKAECGSVAVSIFVNPTQFGPEEDLDAYPRDLARDLDLLAQAGADVVWTPQVQDIYPRGSVTAVEVGELSVPLEGVRRPGHFRGVATVVAILLAVTTPDRLYVGQKDAQQAAVLRRMVDDLGFATEVVVAPTVREDDGLALSSRNAYLTGGERHAARCLSRALSRVDEAWRAGERSAERLRELGRSVVLAEPLAELSYFSVADRETLVEIADGVMVDPGHGALVSTAVRIGAPTLLDNIVLTPYSPS
ncbi:pantothenate synthetase [Austwickia chelonae]|uniref:Pantothenate synthetase n=1 Tax=Austwickia chelonae NBRC 105200 TaxID=1184607 RepID=K6VP79_9MICO|nr:pantoate--beta-alanine ligase [Austwickia chelonae]GAB77180.1 pantothenate synthetase [Austwickia chelonae NBRC 105200]SEW04594.1 pantothenate synthetase [Austwickia chelonae]